MMNKLYVANLPVDTTEHELRLHFAACGGVSDVELLYQRGTGKPRNQACVTMTSPTYATAALTRLDGAVFGGSALRVSDSPPNANKTVQRSVKIVQQFRERGNMTYDLDCAGVPMTLRIFPEGEQWRIEARATDALDAVVISSSAASRREALGGVISAWNERTSAAGPRRLDTDDLVAAMSDVRAV